MFEYVTRSETDLRFPAGGTNSAIHKAAGSLVTSRSLQNGKMSMGNRCTERSQEAVLYGGRQSGGFVNSAVNCQFLGIA